jgi:hypothetical protein
MKHSEYCIVDQLKRTPAKISIMSLILSFEPHHNALQKVLNEAYVPQDIEQKTMEHLVGRIHASNYLYFLKMNLTLKELDITSLFISRSDAKIVSSVKFSSIMAQPLMCCQGIC